MQATNLRNGMIIVHDGELCKIMEFRHHTPGNLRAMVQAKLRNLRTGTQFEHRFRSNDSIDQAYIETHDLDFMYSDGDTYHFMNNENYEQIELSADDLGDMAKWLTDGMTIQGQFHDERPIGVELPKSVRVKVAQTEPMVKGATANASYKPATLENGVVIQVPAFVTDGEELIVDPIEGKYMERAK